MAMKPCGCVTLCEGQISACALHIDVTSLPIFAMPLDYAGVN